MISRTRSTHMTLLLSLAVLLCPTPSAAGPAAKAAGLADGSGAISGTVRGLDLAGYASAIVVAWSADSMPTDDGEVADGSRTRARTAVEPDGTYRLGGLAPGAYYVSAMAKEYETRYYDDVVDVAAATPLEVADGETVEGIDFALERYNSGEGSIAGIVTGEAGGEAIAGAVVHAFAADNPFMYGLAETDPVGAYVIRGLRSGQYIVEVSAPDYLSEFYGDVTQYEEAVPVTVVEPEQAAGIDFALAVGGSITGVVRRGDGGPVAGAYVSAVAPRQTDGQTDDPSDGLADGQHRSDVDEEGRLIPAMPGGWAVTDSSGTYRMGGLATGEYRVLAQVSTHWQHAYTWYDGADDFEQATPVAVIKGLETAAIDLVLDVPIMDSGVAGQVTDAQGRPVAEAFVTVQQAQDWAAVDPVLWEGEGGAVDVDRAYGSASVPDTELRGISHVWAYAPTDKDGRYAIDELPAGTYIVSAASQRGWEHVQRWYPDAISPREATELTVAEGETLNGIDIVLPLQVATASISGTVRDDSGNPLAWAFIQISPPEGSPRTSSLEPARLWAYGQADSTGAYRVDRLPAGTYTVRASYHTGDRFGQSWYDGADSPETATPVVLANDEARTGVDMQFAVRPLYGVVSGTVTDAAGGAPLGRAYVELSPAEPNAVERSVADHNTASSAPADWGFAPTVPLRFGASAAVTDESGAFHIGWIPEGAYTLTVYANGAVADYVHPDADALATPFRVAGGDSIRCDVALSVRHDGEGVIAGTVRLGFEGPGILYGGEEPGVDLGAAEGDGAFDIAGAPWAPVAAPEIAVVVALPVAAPQESSKESPLPGVRYVAVTDLSGAYALRGLAPGDYVVMCFAPHHIGTYYDGAYAPDRAETVHVDGERAVEGIDFELMGLYRFYAVDEDMAGGGEMAPTDAAAGGPTVYGNVADDAGLPVVDATVFLLDADEQPVAFAQTRGDGYFELSGVAPGEYRLYASRVGYRGRYNGNRSDFGAAEPLGLVAGPTEVNIVLSTGKATAVEEDADAGAAIPLTMALHPNFPNPFNPETRIAFAVPASGRTAVHVHNALGQRVVTLYSGVAEAGRPYEVTFRAHGLGAGTYFCVLESGGRRLAQPMSLVK